MVPLRAARLSPRLHSVHQAAIAIGRGAPFSRLSVSLHTGRIGVPEASGQGSRAQATRR